MKHNKSYFLRLITIINTVFTYFEYEEDTCKLFIKGIKNVNTLQKIFLSHPNTKSLIISNTELKEFPAGCHQFKDLERVNYTANYFTIDFSNLKECSNITHLLIHMCGSIPKCYSALTKLTYLSLKNNRLKMFPDEVLTSKSLIVLDLSNNCVMRIPRTIEKLTNLRILFFNLTKVTNIHNLAGLPKLTKLSLHKSNLAFVPISIGLLPNLTSLDLSGNKIRDLKPTTQQKYTFLTNLKKVPCNEFHMNKNWYDFALKRCRCVSLINNIKGWENGIFNLHNLEFLKLTDNFISTIPLELKIFKKLKGIALIRNNIAAIPKDLKMDSLMFLDLYGNNIQSGLQEFQLLNPHTYINLIEESDLFLNPIY